MSLYGRAPPLDAPRPVTVTITAALSEPARTRTAPGRPAPCNGHHHCRSSLYGRAPPLDAPRPVTVTITAALSEPARTRTAPGRPAPCNGHHHCRSSLDAPRPVTVTITAALSEPVRTRTAPGRPAPCNGHHHCRSVRACTDAHRPCTPRALSRPPDRTQGYHEPPYRGLPLYCCGINHAFLDR
ncbi:hypothetical protein J6590_023219 [Homalodisca vitripennis]|nr:hypothetical protein J6590_023219 [Homalodisca vitripennis]